LVTKIDLALLAGGLFAIFLIIRGAGQAFKDFKFPDLGSAIGDITFPEITFPELPSLPSLDFLGGLFGGDDSSSIAGEEVPFGDATVIIPQDTTIDPDTGIVTSSTPPISTGPGATFDEQFFAETKAGVFDTLFETLGLSPTLAASIVAPAKTLADLSKILFQANQGQFTGEFAPDLEQPTAPAGVSAVQEGQVLPGFQVLPSGFEGGGPSFIGGSIFETPIANLSLSQIIDKFMVTASQAANIKAIAANDFGDFDFGTNTGGGIGSIIQTIPGLSGLGGNVSDSQFEGLSLTEIANKLTGGNIQNFA